MGVRVYVSCVRVAVNQYRLFLLSSVVMESMWTNIHARTRARKHTNEAIIFLQRVTKSTIHFILFKGYLINILLFEAVNSYCMVVVTRLIQITGEFV